MIDFIHVLFLVSLQQGLVHEVVEFEKVDAHLCIDVGFDGARQFGENGFSFGEVLGEQKGVLIVFVFFGIFQTLDSAIVE